MKKLIFALMFMLYAGLTAQTFDFTCSGAQGTWSHTAEDFTVEDLVYNTTVIGDESDYVWNALFGPGRYRNRNMEGFHFTPRGGEVYEDGDYLIAKRDSIPEGDVIFIGRINGTFNSDPNGPWSVDIIQNTDPGISVGNPKGTLTVGKIADPTLSAHIHTPGNIDVTIGGENLSFNTAIIGDEFTMPYEAGRASNNYPSGTLVWSNSNPVYLGTGVGLGVSNGSYFIVKYGDDKYLIIQGYQITGNGRIGVQRIVYNTGVTTDISVFNTFASQGDHFTVGRIAAPTIVEDFSHTPGTFESGGYVFNTATSNEERFEFVPFEQVVRDVGDWRLDRADSNRIFFYVSTSDIASYPLDGYVVLKQQDVTGVEDVWIGKIGQTDVNAGDENGNLLAKRVRIDPIHQPSSWSLSENKPIQLGIIADPTAGSFDHTPGEFYSSDRTLLYNTSTSNEFRLEHGDAGEGRWNLGNLQADGSRIIRLYTTGNNIPLSSSGNGNYYIIKQEDTENIDDVWIGKATVGSFGTEGLTQSSLTEVYRPEGWTGFDTTKPIQVGEIADPTEVRVNIRVEIAQPHPSNYSAVENVTIQSDSQSNDPGVNTGILLNTQIDVNQANDNASHAFQENHPVSWFDDATEINLWPRNNSDTPGTNATRTEFTFSPPATPVHEETYTYKYFALDGGATNLGTSIKYHWELSDDYDISGIELIDNAFSHSIAGLAETHYLQIRLKNVSDGSGLEVGDKVIVVNGNFFYTGAISEFVNGGTHINVLREAGHSLLSYNSNHLNLGVSKMYIRK